MGVGSENEGAGGATTLGPFLALLSLPCLKTWDGGKYISKTGTANVFGTTKRCKRKCKVNDETLVLLLKNTRKMRKIKIKDSIHL